MNKEEFEKLFMENFFKILDDDETLKVYEEKSIQIRKMRTKQSNMHYLGLLLDIIKLGFMLVLIVSLGIFITWVISQGVDLIQK